MLLPGHTACVGAAAALLAGAGGAFAQEGPVDFSTDFRVIDEGVEDVNPLGVGRVSFAADLAVPLGFGKVYELPPGPDGQRRFARRSGAVWAVFTRADYIRTQDGKEAVVPPNTTIYVGEPPGLRDAEPQVYSPLYMPLRVSTRQDLRAGVRLDSQTPRDDVADPAQEAGQQEQREMANATILTSEAYRGDRIRELLRAAAAGE